MVTSVAERVNLAPTKRDEADILTIQNELGLGVSDALREPLHLFADIVRLGILENTRRMVSDAKTNKMLSLEERVRELEEENEALRGK